MYRRRFCQYTICLSRVVLRVRRLIAARLCYVRCAHRAHRKLEKRYVDAKPEPGMHQGEEVLAEQDDLICLFCEKALPNQHSVLTGCGCTFCTGCLNAVQDLDDTPKCFICEAPITGVTVEFTIVGQPEPDEEAEAAEQEAEEAEAAEQESEDDSSEGSTGRSPQNREPAQGSGRHSHSSSVSLSLIPTRCA